jgi:hypothetical protein
MFRRPQRIEPETFRGVNLLEPTGIKFGAIAVELGNVSIENVITELQSAYPQRPLFPGRTLPCSRDTGKVFIAREPNYLLKTARLGTLAGDELG